MGSNESDFYQIQKREAYKHWLNVPEEECPPNHYLLLGVDLFEEDVDCIHAATQERLALVRSMCQGDPTKLINDLIREFQLAERVLCTPAERAWYDGELRKRFNIASPDLHSPPLPLGDLKESPSSRKTRNSDKSILPHIVGAVLGSVTVLGGFWLLGGFSEFESRTNKTNDHSGDGQNPTEKTIQPSPTGDSTRRPGGAENHKTTSSKTESPAKPNKSDPNPPRRDDSANAPPEAAIDPEPSLHTGIDPS